MKQAAELEIAMSLRECILQDMIGWLSVVLWTNKALKWAFGHQIVLAIARGLYNFSTINTYFRILFPPRLPVEKS